MVIFETKHNAAFGIRELIEIDAKNLNISPNTFSAALQFFLV